MGFEASVAGQSLRRWFENQLRKIVERFLPMLEVVRVFIHMPNVRDFSFFEISVDALTDANQAVLVAAGNSA